MNPFHPITLRLSFLYVGFLGLFFLGGAPLAPLCAQTTPIPSLTPEATPAKPAWGSVDLGAQYVGWDSNAVPGGSEYLVPLTLSVFPWKDARIYGQTEFASGNYTGAESGYGTDNLSNLTDSVIGFETGFQSFSLPSLVNIGINLPTGDPTWETKQTGSIIPTEFIDSDYRGRGFGLSFLYGLSFQSGSEQYGIAAGYLYSGAFNPSYGEGVPAENLKLGDSTFLSVNHVSDLGEGQSNIIRLSAFYFLPTQLNNSNLLQMGPNVNASFAWNNPKALSFEAGGQYFLPTQNVNPSTGELSLEPNNSLAPRFYFYPSYAIGDLTIAARAKYVLANGYPTTDLVNYDGGGWVLGLGPTLKLKLDSSSSLRISAGYDYVVWSNVPTNIASLGRVNLDYDHWTFGTHYEVSL